MLLNDLGSGQLLPLSFPRPHAKEPNVIFIRETPSTKELSPDNTENTAQGLKRYVRSDDYHKSYDDPVKQGDDIFPGRITLPTELAGIAAQIRNKERPNTYRGKTTVALDNASDRRST